MKVTGLSAVVLLWLGACSGEQPSDLQPATDASTTYTAQDLGTAANVTQELIYDLRGISQYTQAIDIGIGRVRRRTYELADGTQVVIDYDWTGGTIYCTGAAARVKGRLIAEGKVERLDGNQKDGLRLVVEERQYREDGTVAYRGTSTFALGLDDGKISDWPQKGRKLYEVFVKWGTLSPSATRF